MKAMLSIVAACGLGCLLAGAADAEQDRPLLLPSRAVTVDYSVEPDHRPEQQMQVAFAAGGTHMRVDASSAPGTLLIDRERRQAMLLFPPAHMFTVLPGKAQEVDEFLLNDRMHFTREGSAVVAGLACTVWGVRSEKGVARACVTADGVVLRAEGTDPKGRHGSLRATRVDYAPLPDTYFEVPPGYQEVRLPRGALGSIAPTP